MPSPDLNTFKAAAARIMTNHTQDGDYDITRAYLAEHPDAVHAPNTNDILTGADDGMLKPFVPDKPVTPFELGRVLYEARIREAWAFNKDIVEQRLDMFPYPRHPSDADERTQSAMVHLAQAQAKALLKLYRVVAL